MFFLEGTVSIFDKLAPLDFVNNRDYHFAFNLVQEKTAEVYFKKVRINSEEGSIMTTTTTVETMQISKVIKSESLRDPSRKYPF